MMVCAALIWPARAYWEQSAQTLFDRIISSGRAAAYLDREGPEPLVRACLAMTGNAARTLIFASLTMASALAFLVRSRLRAAVPGFVLLIALADLAGSNLSEPRGPAADWDRPSGHISEILQDDALYRVMASPRAYDSAYFLSSETLSEQLEEQKEKLAPNTPLYFGLADAIAYDSIFLDRTFFIRERFKHLSSASQGRFLDMLNIKYVVSPSEDLGPDFRLLRRGRHAHLYENQTVLPRALLSSRAYSPASDADALAKISTDDYDPREHLYLADAAGEQGDVRHVSAGDVRIDSYGAHEVRMTVRSPEGGWLFFSDTYYPGWAARLDSRETLRIYRANVAFRAVKVPAGEHSVVWQYRPTSFFVGAAISVLTALFLITNAKFWIKFLQ